MNLDISFYLKLFWRRLPVMLLFVLLCSGVGIIAALRMPATWETSATLLVEAPEIPDEMVSSTSQVNAIEQLAIIENRLLTRVNLIDIANRFNVFENIRELEPDEVVEKMLEATRITRSAGRNEATLMSISFEARTGKIARDVVDEYVTLVLDQDSSLRGSRTTNTLEFFEGEVARLGVELDRQSSDISAFKSKNANALPEDQSYRLGRLTLLQDQLVRLGREIAAGQAQRQELIKIFEATGRVQSEALQRQRTSEEEQLIVEEATLEHMKTIYSDANPRVRRQQALVDRLKKVTTAQASARLDGELSDGMTEEEVYLNAQLAEIDTRIEYMSADRDKTEDDLDELQRAIAQSSANGIELAALERKYANIQASYDAAVRNLNEAQMNSRIEVTNKGQRIGVIENAVEPRVPTGPDRLKIGIMSTALGIALAGGYFVLLEMLNRTVRCPAELVGRFNISPITTIPYMESRNRRMMRRSGIIATSLVILIGVPLALWYVDTNYLPLEVVVEKGLDKLGLG